MFRHRFARLSVGVFAILIALASVAFSSGAAASIVPVQDEVFDANETEGTIERVRYQLLGVAAVTGVLLVGYIWHTDPERRLRVATRRRDDRERAAMAALDDAFVLPVEVDDDIDDGGAIGESGTAGAEPRADDATSLTADPGVEER